MTKVLIAEDDILLSSILANKFKDAGFEILAALDGDETVEKTKTWIPDLILLDILMPKKDGFQALEEIRALASFATTPVLVLSNLGEKSDMERAKKCGAADYLIKVNTTPKEVVEKVQQMLKK